MRISFNVTFVGGEKSQVTTSPVDMVRTEAYTGKSVANGEPTYTELCYIVYSASRRSGVAGQDFEKWLEMVDSIDQVEDDADPKAPEQD